MSSLAHALAPWRDETATFAFWKGRVALWALLEAAGIGEGDEVLVPGYTCVVVPAAVLYRGARPVYYDIDPRTYNGDLEAARRRVGPATRAVIVQHTYGLPADTAAFRRLAEEKGLLLLEDCAHALGASRDGAPVGTLGHGAFTSLQWSKSVTCGLGGLARAADPALREALGRVHASLPEPSALSLLAVEALHRAHRRLFRPSLYWSAQTLYRRLGNWGLVPPSSGGAELRSATMPAGYARRFGTRRRPALRRALGEAETVVTHRRACEGFYREHLEAAGAQLPPLPAGAAGGALRVPLRVRDRDEVLAWARAEKVELGAWFEAPLHPAEADASAFGWRDGLCPAAESAAREVINLPTHPRVDAAERRRILDFVLARRELWLPLAPASSASPESAAKKELCCP